MDATPTRITRISQFLKSWINGDSEGEGGGGLKSLDLRAIQVRVITTRSDFRII